MNASPKRDLIEGLIAAFRASGNQDSAFENLAADRLGVNRTDLHCLNAIENGAGLTAGELAAEVGLASGAVPGRSPPRARSTHAPGRRRNRRRRFQGIRSAWVR